MLAVPTNKLLGMLVESMLVGCHPQLVKKIYLRFSGKYTRFSLYGKLEISCADNLLFALLALFYCVLVVMLWRL